MARKFTMQQLIQKKKELLRIKPISLDTQKKVNEIERMIDKKINLSDQNFFRTFYKTAKEQLTEETFLEVEGIASTRFNDYIKGKSNEKV